MHSTTGFGKLIKEVDKGISSLKSLNRDFFQYKAFSIKVDNGYITRNHVTFVNCSEVH